MAVIIVQKRPLTPGSRARIDVKETDLYKGRPERSLVSSKMRISARNSQGRITVRHRGGGHKRLYRLIDFKRTKDGIPATVERLEYDPNRSANIALLVYKDGEKRYIIAPRGIKAGDQLMSGAEAPFKVGNAMPMKHIPEGTTVHCIEARPGSGAQYARSAGIGAQLLAKDAGYVTLRFQSGEVRKLHEMCRATIGSVGHSEHNLRSLGKAGASRHRGIRPTVRGVAMNPVDHPHGGGEGRTSGGRHPVSRTGVPTKGYKTRKRSKSSNKYILVRRGKGKQGK